MKDIAKSPGRVAALAAFGAVVLSAFDGFHTHSGTTRYATTVVWEAAWWTPLIFAFSTGVGGPVYVGGYRLLGGQRSPPGWGALALGVAIYGALYWLSGFYAGTNAMKLALLAAAAVPLYGWLDRTVPGAVMALVTTIAGPLVEIVLVRAGVFEYLHPDFLGVPIWLPALHTCSAVVLGQGARRLLD